MPRDESGLSRPTNTQALDYQPALDGVRAIAIVAVLLYHGGVRSVPGGFLGVDVFFALSGFLITSLLLREHTTTGTIALGEFYARRARRLFPALIIALIGVGFYSVLFVPELSRGSLRADGLAALTYVQNWHLIVSRQSYFQQFTTPSPLRHTWSLAIEEQWYLVWPLIVVVVLRFSPVAAPGSLSSPVCSPPDQQR